MLNALDTFSPKRLLEMRFGYIASRTIGAALELGFFEALASSAKSIAVLAEELKCSLRGTRTLAQSLQVLELVHIDDGELVSLAADTRHYLTSQSPFYLGGMILASDRNWDRWANLADTIRRGGPVQPTIESDEDNGAFFSMFVAGLDNLNRPAAERVARHLGTRSGRILDLGCGSAVWSRALAVDRESVHRAVTRPYLERAGVLQQYKFQCGNLRSVPLESSAYDVAFLGHILHSEGAERSVQLLTRVRSALKPGGVAVIAEMVPDDARRQDRYGVLFGMNMLMLTEHGEVFTRSELQGLLQQAGFREHAWLQDVEPYPVLLATNS
jgi:SAM-dependent methyltransferase